MIRASQPKKYILHTYSRRAEQSALEAQPNSDHKELRTKHAHRVFTLRVDRRALSEQANEGSTLEGMSDHNTRPSEAGGNAANDGAKSKKPPSAGGEAFLPPVRRQGDLVNQPPDPPSRKIRRPTERARRLSPPKAILGKPGQGKSVKSWPVWLPYVLVGLLLLLVASTFITSRKGDTVSYDTFLSRAKAGEVSEASFTNGTGSVRGKFVDGTKFRTSGPDQLSVDDRNDLRAVSLTFRSPGRSIWEGPLGLFLPILMVFGLLTLLSRRSSAGGMGGPGGVMQIGKSRAKL